MKAIRAILLSFLLCGGIVTPNRQYRKYDSDEPANGLSRLNDRVNADGDAPYENKPNGERTSEFEKQKPLLSGLNFRKKRSVQDASSGKDWGGVIKLTKKEEGSKESENDLNTQEFYGKAVINGLVVGQRIISEILGRIHQLIEGLVTNRLALIVEPVKSVLLEGQKEESSPKKGNSQSSESATGSEQPQEVQQQQPKTDTSGVASAVVVVAEKGQKSNGAPRNRRSIPNFSLWRGLGLKTGHSNSLTPSDDNDKVRKPPRPTIADILNFGAAIRKILEQTQAERAAYTKSLDLDDDFTAWLLAGPIFSDDGFVRSTDITDADSDDSHAEKEAEEEKNVKEHTEEEHPSNGMIPYQRSVEPPEDKKIERPSYEMRYWPEDELYERYGTPGRRADVPYKTGRRVYRIPEISEEDDEDHFRDPYLDAFGMYGRFKSYRRRPITRRKYSSWSGGWNPDDMTFNHYYRQHPYRYYYGRSHEYDSPPIETDDHGYRWNYNNLRRRGEWSQDDWDRYGGMERDGENELMNGEYSIRDFRHNPWYETEYGAPARPYEWYAWQRGMGNKEDQWMSEDSEDKHSHREHQSEEASSEQNVEEKGKKELIQDGTKKSTGESSKLSEEKSTESARPEENISKSKKDEALEEPTQNDEKTVSNEPSRETQQKHQEEEEERQEKSKKKSYLSIDYKKNCIEDPHYGYYYDKLSRDKLHPQPFPILMDVPIKGRPRRRKQYIPSPLLEFPEINVYANTYNGELSDDLYDHMTGQMISTNLYPYNDGGAVYGWSRGKGSKQRWRNSHDSEDLYDYGDGYHDVSVEERGESGKGRDGYESDTLLLSDSRHNSNEKGENIKHSLIATKSEKDNDHHETASNNDELSSTAETMEEKHQKKTSEKSGGDFRVAASNVHSTWVLPSESVSPEIANKHPKTEHGEYENSWKSIKPLAAGAHSTGIAESDVNKRDRGDGANSVALHGVSDEMGYGSEAAGADMGHGWITWDKVGHDRHTGYGVGKSEVVKQSTGANQRINTDKDSGHKMVSGKKTLSDSETVHGRGWLLLKKAHAGVKADGLREKIKDKRENLTQESVDKRRRHKMQEQNVGEASAVAGKKYKLASVNAKAVAHAKIGNADATSVSNSDAKTKLKTRKIGEKIITESEAKATALARAKAKSINGDKKTGEITKESDATSTAYTHAKVKSEKDGKGNVKDTVSESKGKSNIQAYTTTFTKENNKKEKIKGGTSDRTDRITIENKKEELNADEQHKVLTASKDGTTETNTDVKKQGHADAVTVTKESNVSNKIDVGDKKGHMNEHKKSTEQHVSSKAVKTEKDDKGNTKETVTESENKSSSYTESSSSSMAEKKAGGEYSKISVGSDDGVEYKWLRLLLTNPNAREHSQIESGVKVDENSRKVKDKREYLTWLSGDSHKDASKSEEEWRKIHGAKITGNEEVMLRHGWGEWEHGVHENLNKIHSENEVSNSERYKWLQMHEHGKIESGGAINEDHKEIKDEHLKTLGVDKHSKIVSRHGGEKIHHELISGHKTADVTSGTIEYHGDIENHHAVNEHHKNVKNNELKSTSVDKQGKILLGHGDKNVHHELISGHNVIQHHGDIENHHTTNGHHKTIKNDHLESTSIDKHQKVPTDHHYKKVHGESINEHESGANHGHHNSRLQQDWIKKATGEATSETQTNVGGKKKLAAVNAKAVAHAKIGNADATSVSNSDAKTKSKTHKIGDRTITESEAKASALAHAKAKSITGDKKTGEITKESDATSTAYTHAKVKSEKDGKGNVKDTVSESKGKSNSQAYTTTLTKENNKKEKIKGGTSDRTDRITTENKKDDLNADEQHKVLTTGKDGTTETNTDVKKKGHADTVTVTKESNVSNKIDIGDKKGHVNEHKKTTEQHVKKVEHTDKLTTSRNKDGSIAGQKSVSSTSETKKTTEEHVKKEEHSSDNKHKGEDGHEWSTHKSSSTNESKKTTTEEHVTKGDHADGLTSSAHKKRESQASHKWNSHNSLSSTKTEEKKATSEKYHTEESRVSKSTSVKSSEHKEHKEHQQHQQHEERNAYKEYQEHHEHNSKMNLWEKYKWWWTHTHENHHNSKHSETNNNNEHHNHETISGAHSNALHQDTTQNEGTTSHDTNDHRTRLSSLDSNQEIDQRYHNENIHKTENVDTDSHGTHNSQKNEHKDHEYRKSHNDNVAAKSDRFAVWVSPDASQEPPKNDHIEGGDQTVRTDESIGTGHTIDHGKSEHGSDHHGSADVHTNQESTEKEEVKGEKEKEEGEEEKIVEEEDDIEAINFFNKVMAEMQDLNGGYDAFMAALDSDAASHAASNHDYDLNLHGDQISTANSEIAEEDKGNKGTELSSHELNEHSINEKTPTEEEIRRLRSEQSDKKETTGEHKSSDTQGGHEDEKIQDENHNWLSSSGATEKIESQGEAGHVNSETKSESTKLIKERKEGASKNEKHHSIHGNENSELSASKSIHRIDKVNEHDWLSTSSQSEKIASHKKETKEHSSKNEKHTSISTKGNHETNHESKKLSATSVKKTQEEIKKWHESSGTKYTLIHGEHKTAEHSSHVSSSKKIEDKKHTSETGTESHRKKSMKHESEANSAKGTSVKETAHKKTQEHELKSVHETHEKNSHEKKEQGVLVSGKTHGKNDDRHGKEKLESSPETQVVREKNGKEKEFDLETAASSASKTIVTPHGYRKSDGKKSRIEDEVEKEGKSRDAMLDKAWRKSDVERKHGTESESVVDYKGHKTSRHETKTSKETEKKLASTSHETANGSGKVDSKKYSAKDTHKLTVSSTEMRGHEYKREKVEEKKISEKVKSHDETDSVSTKKGIKQETKHKKIGHSSESSVERESAVKKHKTSEKVTEHGTIRKEILSKTSSEHVHSKHESEEKKTIGKKVDIRKHTADEKVHVIKKDGSKGISEIESSAEHKENDSRKKETLESAHAETADDENKYKRNQIWTPSAGLSEAVVKTKTEDNDIHKDSHEATAESGGTVTQGKIGGYDSGEKKHSKTYAEEKAAEKKQETSAVPTTLHGEKEKNDVQGTSKLASAQEKSDQEKRIRKEKKEPREPQETVNYGGRDDKRKNGNQKKVVSSETTVSRDENTDKDLGVHKTPDVSTERTTNDRAGDSHKSRGTSSSVGADDNKVAAQRGNPREQHGVWSSPTADVGTGAHSNATPELPEYAKKIGKSRSKEVTAVGTANAASPDVAHEAKKPENHDSLKSSPDTVANSRTSENDEHDTAKKEHPKGKQPDKSIKKPEKPNDHPHHPDLSKKEGAAPQSDSPGEKPKDDKHDAVSQGENAGKSTNNENSKVEKQKKPDGSDVATAQANVAIKGIHRKEDSHDHSGENVKPITPGKSHTTAGANRESKKTGDEHETTQVQDTADAHAEVGARRENPHGNHELVPAASQPQKTSVKIDGKHKKDGSSSQEKKSSDSTTNSKAQIGKEEKHRATDEKGILKKDSSEIVETNANSNTAKHEDVSGKEGAGKSTSVITSKTTAEESISKQNHEKSLSSAESLKKISDKETTRGEHMWSEANMYDRSEWTLEEWLEWIEKTSHAYNEYEENEKTEEQSRHHDSAGTIHDAENHDHHKATFSKSTSHESNDHTKISEKKETLKTHHDKSAELTSNDTSKSSANRESEVTKEGASKSTTDEKAETIKKKEEKNSAASVTEGNHTQESKKKKEMIKKQHDEHSSRSLAKDYHAWESLSEEEKAAIMKHQSKHITKPIADGHRVQSSTEKTELAKKDKHVGVDEDHDSWKSVKKEEKGTMEKEHGVDLIESRGHHDLKSSSENHDRKAVHETEKIAGKKTSHKTDKHVKAEKHGASSLSTASEKTDHAKTHDHLRKDELSVGQTLTSKEHTGKVKHINAVEEKQSKTLTSMSREAVERIAKKTHGSANSGELIAKDSHLHLNEVSREKSHHAGVVEKVAETTEKKQGDENNKHLIHVVTAKESKKHSENTQKESHVTKKHESSTGRKSIDNIASAIAAVEKDSKNVNKKHTEDLAVSETRKTIASKTLDATKHSKESLHGEEKTSKISKENLHKELTLAKKHSTSKATNEKHGIGEAVTKSEESNEKVNKHATKENEIDWKSVISHENKESVKEEQSKASAAKHSKLTSETEEKKTKESHGSSLRKESQNWSEQHAAQSKLSAEKHDKKTLETQEKSTKEWHESSESSEHKHSMTESSHKSSEHHDSKEWNEWNSLMKSSYLEEYSESEVLSEMIERIIHEWYEFSYEEILLIYEWYEVWVERYGVRIAEAILIELVEEAKWLTAEERISLALIIEKKYAEKLYEYYSKNSLENHQWNHEMSKHRKEMKTQDSITTDSVNDESSSVAKVDAVSGNQVTSKKLNGLSSVVSEASDEASANSKLNQNRLVGVTTEGTSSLHEQLNKEGKHREKTSQKDRVSVGSNSDSSNLIISNKYVNAPKHNRKPHIIYYNHPDVHKENQSYKKDLHSYEKVKLERENSHLGRKVNNDGEVSPVGEQPDVPSPRKKPEPVKHVPKEPTKGHDQPDTVHNVSPTEQRPEAPSPYKKPESVKSASHEDHPKENPQKYQDKPERIQILLPMEQQPEAESPHKEPKPAKHTLHEEHPKKKPTTHEDKPETTGIVSPTEEHPETLNQHKKPLKPGKHAPEKGHPGKENPENNQTIESPHKPKEHNDKSGTIGKVSPTVHQPESQSPYRKGKPKGHVPIGSSPETEKPVDSPDAVHKVSPTHQQPEDSTPHKNQEPVKHAPHENHPDDKNLSAHQPEVSSPHQPQTEYPDNQVKIYGRLPSWYHPTGQDKRPDNVHEESPTGQPILPTPNEKQTPSETAPHKDHIHNDRPSETPQIPTEYGENPDTVKKLLPTKHKPETPSHHKSPEPVKHAPHKDHPEKEPTEHKGKPETIGKVSPIEQQSDDKPEAPIHHKKPEPVNHTPHKDHPEKEPTKHEAKPETIGKVSPIEQQPEHKPEAPSHHKRPEPVKDAPHKDRPEKEPTKHKAKPETIGKVSPIEQQPEHKPEAPSHHKSPEPVKHAPHKDHPEKEPTNHKDAPEAIGKLSPIEQHPETPSPQKKSEPVKHAPSKNHPKNEPTNQNENAPKNIGKVSPIEQHPETPSPHKKLEPDKNAPSKNHPKNEPTNQNENAPENIGKISPTEQHPETLSPHNKPKSDKQAPHKDHPKVEHTKHGVIPKTIGKTPPTEQQKPPSPNEKEASKKHAPLEETPDKKMTVDGRLPVWYHPTGHHKKPDNVHKDSSTGQPTAVASPEKHAPNKEAPHKDTRLNNDKPSVSTHTPIEHGTPETVPKATSIEEQPTAPNPHKKETPQKHEPHKQLPHEKPTEKRPNKAHPEKGDLPTGHPHKPVDHPHKTDKVSPVENQQVEPSPHKKQNPEENVPHKDLPHEKHPHQKNPEEGNHSIGSPHKPAGHDNSPNTIVKLLPTEQQPEAPNPHKKQTPEKHVSNEHAPHKDQPGKTKPEKGDKPIGSTHKPEDHVNSPDVIGKVSPTEQKPKAPSPHEKQPPVTHTPHTDYPGKESPENNGVPAGHPHAPVEQNNNPNTDNASPTKQNQGEVPRKKQPEKHTPEKHVPEEQTPDKHVPQKEHPGKNPKNDDLPTRSPGVPKGHVGSPDDVHKGSPVEQQPIAPSPQKELTPKKDEPNKDQPDNKHSAEHPVKHQPEASSPHKNPEANEHTPHEDNSNNKVKVYNRLPIWYHPTKALAPNKEQAPNEKAPHKEHPHGDLPSETPHVPTEHGDTVRKLSPTEHKPEVPNHHKKPEPTNHVPHKDRPEKEPAKHEGKPKTIGKVSPIAQQPNAPGHHEKPQPMTHAPHKDYPEKEPAKDQDKPDTKHTASPTEHQPEVSSPHKKPEPNAHAPHKDHPEKKPNNRHDKPKSIQMLLPTGHQPKAGNPNKGPTKYKDDTKTIEKVSPTGQQPETPSPHKNPEPGKHTPHNDYPKNKSAKHVGKPEDDQKVSPTEQQPVASSPNEKENPTKHVAHNNLPDAHSTQPTSDHPTGIPVDTTKPKNTDTPSSGIPAHTDVSGKHAEGTSSGIANAKAFAEQLTAASVKGSPKICSTPGEPTDSTTSEPPKKKCALLCEVLKQKSTDVYVVKKDSNGLVGIANLKKVVPPYITYRLIPKEVYQKIRNLIASSQVSQAVYPIATSSS